MTARQEAIIGMFGREPSDSIDLRGGSSIVGWEFEHCTTLEQLQQKFSIEEIERLYEEYIGGDVILSDSDSDLIDRAYELDKRGELEDYKFDAAQYKASLSFAQKVKNSIPLYQK